MGDMLNIFDSFNETSRLSHVFHNEPLDVDFGKSLVPQVSFLL